MAIENRFTIRLLSELGKMKKQILQPPSNTAELLGRSAYLEEARNKPLNDLTASIHELKEHFVRLTDIVIYTEADVIRSAQAFFGPDEIVPMLDDGAEVYRATSLIFNRKCNQVFLLADSPVPSSV